MQIHHCSTSMTNCSLLYSLQLSLHLNLYNLMSKFPQSWVSCLSCFSTVSSNFLLSRSFFFKTEKTEDFCSASLNFSSKVAASRGVTSAYLPPSMPTSWRYEDQSQLVIRSRSCLKYRGTFTNIYLYIYKEK